MLVKTPPCPRCGDYATLDLTETQIELLRTPSRPLIQEILPELSPDDRERFVTGYCPQCWEDIFS